MEQLVDDCLDAAELGHPQCVVVRFGGSRYAVPMRSVLEVVPVPRMTRVPATPRWLAGVVNWRGRVLPVVDLRPVMGADQPPLPSSARLLVLSDEDIEAGLLVEAVAGLLEAGPDIPDAAPATASASASLLVSGVLDDGTGPVSLLVAAAVLRIRSELPSVRR